MANEALYENASYRVVITSIHQDKHVNPVKCYGVENKETGVIEHYVMSIAQAKAKAEVEAAMLENEWWKNQAAMEIEILHAGYSTKLAS